MNRESRVQDLPGGRSEPTSSDTDSFENHAETPEAAADDRDRTIVSMPGSSIVNPMIKPRVDQLMFLELADQMNGRQILCKRPSGQQTTDPEFVPGLGELERRIALSVAYHRKQTYGHLANVDDFAFCDELPVSLNLDLLKINCKSVFLWLA